MLWDRIKRMLGGKGEPGEPGPVRTQATQQDESPAPAQDMPELRWIEAADNPWGVRVLDEWRDLPGQMSGGMAGILPRDPQGSLDFTPIKINTKDVGLA